MKRFLGILFCSFLFLLSCGSGEPVSSLESPDPGAPATILRKLAWGDGAFLDVLEPTEELAAELRAVSVSGPYKLARAYEARGLPESARFIYRAELDAGTAPWSGRSAVRLARLAAQDRRWLLAEGYARRGVEILPNNRDIWYRYGEALYRQERYEDLLELTEGVPSLLTGSDSGEGEEITPLELAAEVLLWRAVASYHLDRESERRFLEAFTRVPAQAIHSRLYLFLYYRASSLAAFSPEVRRMLEAVYRSSVGEHAEARRLMLLIPPDFFARTLLDHSGYGSGERTPALLRTLMQSADTGDRRVEQWLLGLQEMQSLQDYLPELLVAHSRFIEARGDRSEALRVLASAVDRDRPEYVRDWVQTAIRAGSALPLVLEQLNQWEAEAEEYSLAVDRLLPVMIRERRWEDVEGVYQDLPPPAAEARAQLGVVSVLLDRDGLHPLPEGEGDRRLREALERSPVTYYGLLARRLAGEAVTLPFGTVRENRAEGNSEVDHVRALVAAGQVETARRRSMVIALDGEAAESSMELARLFYRLGHASAALDLARRAVARGDLPVEEDDIALLYPRPFAREIGAAAEEYGVPEAVLFGLIREESHFNPRARSHVGATGLAQVMPATAEDLVRRLGWAGADLERVSDNVRMGAFYMRHLAEQLPDQLILQLAAYNAGPGRGRTWAGQFGDLSPELQVEALPFIETRWYLRRIAVSSAWYDFRMTGRDPASAMPLFP